MAFSTNGFLTDFEEGIIELMEDTISSGYKYSRNTEISDEEIDWWVDGVMDWKNEFLNNSVGTYWDSWDIIEAFRYFDWSDSELGPLTNIQQVAYSAMDEFLRDNVDIELFVEDQLKQLKYGF